MICAQYITLCLPLHGFAGDFELLDVMAEDGSGAETLTELICRPIIIAAAGALHYVVTPSWPHYKQAGQGDFRESPRVVFRGAADSVILLLVSENNALIVKFHKTQYTTHNPYNYHYLF